MADTEAVTTTKALAVVGAIVFAMAGFMFSKIINEMDELQTIAQTNAIDIAKISCKENN